MKKIISILLTSLLVMSFTTCSDDDTPRFYIKLSETSLEANIQAQEYPITITSNTHWKVKDNPEWISVSQTEGTPSDQKLELTIQVKFNDTEEEREGVITFVSNTTTAQLKVKQLGITGSEAFIKFNKAEIKFNQLTEQVVKVTSNVNWKINDIPSWLTIVPSSGNGSQEITITPTENHHPLSREVNLEFVNKNTTSKFLVKQIGLRDIITAPSLYIFHKENISFNWPITKCEVNTGRYFINAQNVKSVFVGNLISHKVPNYPILTEFSGYTFNPTDLGTSSLLVKPIEYTPSLAENKAYAQAIIDSTPQSILSYKTGSPESFYTYRQLHAIGMINLGLDLDKLISGKSYKEEEMNYLYGMIYSYKKAVFDIIRDMPEDGKVVKEDLKDVDKAKGVSYISHIHYGQIGLLFVETNTDDREIKPIIQKALRDEALTSNETYKLETSRFSYVYFNNENKVQIKQGALEIIEEYKNGMKDNKNIYPIEFFLLNYETHGMQSINYIYNLN